MKIVVSSLKAFEDHNSNMVQNIELTINKLEHCGIRTKANYWDFLLSFSTVTSKALLQSVVEKCHCVVKGEISASLVLEVICKILSILSHPFKGPFLLAFLRFINVIFFFFNTCSMLVL